MPVKLIDLPVISTQKTSCMPYNETVNHRILTAAKEKNVACRGTPIRQSDFSAETPQARTEWNDIAEVLKDNNCQQYFVLQSHPSDVREKSGLSQTNRN